MDRIINELKAELNIVTARLCDVGHLDEIIERCKSIYKELYGDDSYELETLIKTFFSEKVRSPFAESTAIYDSVCTGLKLVIGNLKGRLDAQTINRAMKTEVTQIKNEISFSKSSNKVFIVHGHDNSAKSDVARFIEKGGLTAIILHEQSSASKTIVEKLESNSDVSFAIAILSPDDEGPLIKNSSEREKRARQNVLLEIGYFHGKLGRDRIFVLRKADVCVPSDYSGIVWHPYDDNEGWKLKLAKELLNAGIDFNKEALY